MTFSPLRLIPVMSRRLIIWRVAQWSTLVSDLFYEPSFKPTMSSCTLLVHAYCD